MISKEAKIQWNTTNMLSYVPIERCSKQGKLVRIRQFCFSNDHINPIKIYLYNGICSSKMGLECMLQVAVRLPVQLNTPLNSSIWSLVTFRSRQSSQSIVMEFNNTKWFPPTMMWSANEREKCCEKYCNRTGLILIEWNFWNFRN